MNIVKSVVFAAIIGAGTVAIAQQNPQSPDSGQNPQTPGSAEPQQQLVLLCGITTVGNQELLTCMIPQQSDSQSPNDQSPDNPQDEAAPQNDSASPARASAPAMNPRNNNNSLPARDANQAIAPADEAPQNHVEYGGM